MSRREFPVKVKMQAAVRANGKCERCGVKIPAGGFHFDHHDPDGLGGEPTLANCRVLCIPCHKDKTREDNARMTKADNQRKRVALGIKPTSKTPLPFGRNSAFKRKLDGTIVKRGQS